MVFNIGLISPFEGYSQEALQKEKLDINGVQILIYKYPMVKTDEELCEIPSDIKLIKGGKQVYYKRICAVELEEVQIRVKGYLTVIEHYSSPVGWSQFYVFDLCKMRLIITKRLAESPGLPWNEFSNPTDEFSKQYVEQTILLK